VQNHTNKNCTNKNGTNKNGTNKNGTNKNGTNKNGTNKHPKIIQTIKIIVNEIDHLSNETNSEYKHR
jgi:hypothetical protein